MATEAFMLAPLQLILAKAEAAYGTEPTPAPDGTNAIRARRFVARRVVDQAKRTNRRATFAANKQVLAAAHWEFEIDLDLKGPDAPSAGDPIVVTEADPFLQAAQFYPTGTGTPVDKITYNPSSSATQKSLTLWWYTIAAGGAKQVHKATGCVFSKKLIVPANGVAYWQFTGKGIYNGEPAVASSLPSPTYKQESDCSVGRGCTLTHDAMSDVVSNLEIDFGQTVVDRRKPGGTYGFHGFAVIGGQPKIKVDPEAQTEAAYTLIADLLDGATNAFSLTVPTIEGGEWVFEVDRAQVANVTDAGEDILKHELDIIGVDDDGDDSISFYCQRAT